jgi:hypothetical protein
VIGEPLPRWATAIPDHHSNYSIAFHIYSPKLSRGCALTAFLFGPRCGFCRDDCHDLMAQVCWAGVERYNWEHEKPFETPK